LVSLEVLSTIDTITILMSYALDKYQRSFLKKALFQGNKEMKFFINGA